MMRTHSRGYDRGFSLLEAVIVVSMLMAISAIATPNMMTVVANARLRGGATSLSGLLQNSRMMALKVNKVETVHFTVMSHGPVAYIDVNQDGAYENTDPQVQLGAPMTKITMPSGPGAPPPIDDTTLTFTDVRTSDPSFNAYGLPCRKSGVSCVNHGFVYYFTDTRPLGKSGWAAVSITPAGRIKTWFWNGSNWVN